MAVDPGANVHVVTEADEHPLRNQRRLAQPIDLDTAWRYGTDISGWRCFRVRPGTEGMDVGSTSTQFVVFASMS